MKVYISGPISTVTDVSLVERKRRFYRTEDWCNKWMPGWYPINPLNAEPCSASGCGDDDGHAWKCWLKYDLIALLECDAIALLPHYRDSKGSQLELLVAKALGFQIFYASEHGQVFMNDDATGTG